MEQFLVLPVVLRGRVWWKVGTGDLHILKVIYIRLYIQLVLSLSTANHVVAMQLSLLNLTRFCSSLHCTWSVSQVHLTRRTSSADGQTQYMASWFTWRKYKEDFDTGLGISPIKYKLSRGCRVAASKVIAQSDTRFSGAGSSFRNQLYDI
jgi:hypothetical protein